MIQYSKIEDLKHLDRKRYQCWRMKIKVIIQKKLKIKSSTINITRSY